MTERLVGTGPERDQLLEQADKIRQKLNKSREQILEREGIGAWLAALGQEINHGSIPEISGTELELLAQEFKNAGIDWSNFPPEHPTKPDGRRATTETPINQARKKGLNQIFPRISPDIGRLVTAIAKLRSREPKTLGPLRKGVVEVLADLVLAAWATEKKPELAPAATRALTLSLTARITKGAYREQRSCRREVQNCLIYLIRGLRDLPPGSLELIGQFLEEQLEANDLMNRVVKTEQLRVAAATGDDYDDVKYLQALEITRTALQIQRRDQFSANPEDWPSRKIAAVAHLHLMIATIQQSRAKHIFSQNPEQQEGVLIEAKEHLEQAAQLATILHQRSHLHTADGNPFLWPVEIARGQARLEERWPNADRNNLKAALRFYQQAMHRAKEIESDDQLPEEMRQAALMALGTAKIEAVLIEIKLQKLSKEGVFTQFKQALTELITSWDQGYKNWDRVDAGLARMLEILSQEEYRDPELYQRILQWRISVLEEASEWDPNAGQRLAKIQEQMPEAQ